MSKLNGSTMGFSKSTTTPTFSLSTILEHAFQNFYPRVLGGIHNHLYSEKSDFRRRKI